MKHYCNVAGTIFLIVTLFYLTCEVSIPFVFMFRYSRLCNKLKSVCIMKVYETLTSDLIQRIYGKETLFGTYNNIMALNSNSLPSPVSDLHSILAWRSILFSSMDCVCVCVCVSQTGRMSCTQSDPV